MIVLQNLSFLITVNLSDYTYMLGIIPDIEDPPVNKTRKAYSFSFIWILIEDLPCADNLLGTWDTIVKKRQKSLLRFSWGQEE